MPSMPDLRASVSDLRSRFYRFWSSSESDKSNPTNEPKPLTESQAAALLDALKAHQEKTGRGISKDNVIFLSDGKFAKISLPPDLVKEILEENRPGMRPQEGIPPAKVPTHRPGLDPSRHKSSEKQQTERQRPKTEAIETEQDKPETVPTPVEPSAAEKEDNAEQAQEKFENSAKNTKAPQKPKTRYEVIKATVYGYLTNHTEMVLKYPVQSIIYSIAIKAFCIFIAPAFELLAYTTFGASIIIFESAIIFNFSAFGKGLLKSITDTFWRVLGVIFRKQYV